MPKEKPDRGTLRRSPNGRLYFIPDDNPRQLSEIPKSERKDCQVAINKYFKADVTVKIPVPEGAQIWWDSTTGVAKVKCEGLEHYLRVRLGDLVGE